MMKHSDRSISRTAQAETTNTKKRYEAPRVLYRESLEAVAAACVPTDPPPANGKTSVPATCGVNGS